MMIREENIGSFTVITDNDNYKIITVTPSVNVDELIVLIERNFINGIHFFDDWASGFGDFEINKLVGNKNIKYVSLSFGTQNLDLDFLYSLELDVLHIDEITPQKVIKFEYLKRLKKCSLHWFSGYESIFEECKDLNELTLYNYNKPDLTNFLSFSQLQRLKLVNCSTENLQDIEYLSYLKIIEFYKCNQLSSLENIQKLYHLEKLVLESCKKLTNLAPLYDILSLKFLILHNMGKIILSEQAHKFFEKNQIRISGNTKIIYL